MGAIVHLTFWNLSRLKDSWERDIPRPISGLLNGSVDSLNSAFIGPLP